MGTSKNADGQDVPLITVPDEDDTTSTGQLDLLTVQVSGNRERTPSWLELAGAWFDRSRAVVPIDRIFPAGQSTEQRNNENAALMTDSQNEASAAALRELGYDVPAEITVMTIDEAGASAGRLQQNDVITSSTARPSRASRRSARRSRMPRAARSPSASSATASPVPRRSPRARRRRTVRRSTFWASASASRSISPST